MKKSFNIGANAGNYLGFRTRQYIESIKLFFNLIFDFISILTILFIVLNFFNVYTLLVGLHIILVLISTVINRIKNVKTI